MADSGTYTPETIARRLAMAQQLLGEPKQPVRHWAEGLNELAKGYFGGKLYSDAEKSEKANETAQTAALMQMLHPGGSPAVASSPGPASEISPAAGPAYGSRTAATSSGDEIPLPPRNPLGVMSPEFRSKFPELRSAAADKGVYFDAPEPGSIGSVRTPETQAGLYAQGRTEPGPIVTGTLNSNHLTGNAMDVVPRGSDAKQVGSVVSALIKSDPRFSGMRSGATFSNPYDPLHVEMNKGGTRVASNDPSIGVGRVSPDAAPASAVTPPSAPPVQMAQAMDTKAQIIKMLSDPNPAVQRMGRQLATGLVQKQFTEDVPTNDMKEYKAAKAQGFTGTLLDYQTKLKEAGKPVTNINQQQESEYQKATGKQLAEQNMEIAKAAGSARGKIATLTRLDTMLKDPAMYTGKGGEGVLELKRLGKAIGIDVGDVGPAEAVKSISNQFALELRNPSGGAGMPGAMSDKDREFLQSMVPGLGQNPQGNALIIDYMKRVAQRSVDVDKLRQQYVRKNGRLDEGFYNELSDWSEAHPVFSDDDMKKAAPPAAPAGGASIDDLLRKYGGSK